VTGNEARNMFQMKMNVDHQGPRPLLNNRHVAEPPCFSLYLRTFKEVFLCITQMNKTSFRQKKKNRKEQSHAAVPFFLHNA
jgi:hypothetical protein